MFDLEIYKTNGHFFYSENDDLQNVCNAQKKWITTHNFQFFHFLRVSPCLLR